MKGCVNFENNDLNIAIEIAIEIIFHHSITAIMTLDFQFGRLLIL